MGEHGSGSNNRFMDWKLDRRQVFLRGAAAGLGATAFAASLSRAGFSASAQGDTTGLVTVANQQVQTWIRNFNFLVAGSSYLWPADNGIYEPMMVANRINGDLVPWLAESYQVADDGLTMTWAIRQGVKWSDGQPFSASDVAYTFNLLKGNEALSGGGGIRNVLGITDSIEASDGATVVFKFSKAYSPGLYDIAAVNIVPEHVWSQVADPVTFTNENPVGTGPFTEVPVFESNYWELRKNPNYWRPERIRIEGLRFPVYNDNDTIQRDMVAGTIDWPSSFIPDIDKVYVSQDPDHFGYWFPPTGDTVHLYLNTTVKPFDDVNVRKAISMAINRDDICSFAEYDYAVPADSTGLSGAYPSWKNDAYTKEAWVSMDADAANKLLDAAGLTKNGDTRTGPDGKPMEYELLVVNGWTDWVQTCDIITDNLAKVGIKATVTPLEQSVWQTERVGKGNFTMSLGWSSGGITPFNFYRGVMSKQTVQPVGTLAAENWHRFDSPDADKLLDQFAASSDPAEQKQIADQLQQLYSQLAPAVPLFPGPQWYEYNLRRFDNWPTKDNPYCIGSNYAAERLILLSSISVKGQPALEPLRGSTTQMSAGGTPTAGTPEAGTPEATPAS